jgi:uncharacterized membrane protein YeaQ/YmgE (transglycosylase-associated protein family)
MLTILGWLFVGLLAGSIGQVFIPGKDPGGIDGTVLLGMGGAFTGGLISGSPLRAQGDTGFLISLGLSVLGAVGVLVVYRLAIAFNFRGWFSSRAACLKRPSFGLTVPYSDEVSRSYPQPALDGASQRILHQ